MVKPEFVTPTEALFCAEENTTSTNVVEADAGYYAKEKIVEGAGVVLGDGEIPTLEFIQENYDKIADMSEAALFDSANDIMRHVFRALRPRE